MTEIATRTTEAGPAAPVPPRPRVRASRVLLRILYTYGLLVVLVLVWQLATVLNPSPFFPTPLAILQNSVRLFFGGSDGQIVTEAVTRDTAGTVARMLAGFLLGSLAGVVIGTFMGLSRIASATATPVVEFLRSIPGTATLPLFIVLLGGDDGMRVAFIAYGCTWFVLVNTAKGVGSINPGMLEMGRSFRISRWKQFRGIVLPAALPQIFAGLRIASIAALMLAVVSEFMLATNGVGHALLLSQGRFLLLDMWSWMLMLALVGLVLNTALELIENSLLGWYREQQDNGRGTAK